MLSKIKERCSISFLIFLHFCAFLDGWSNLPYAVLLKVILISFYIAGEVALFWMPYIGFRKPLNAVVIWVLKMKASVSDCGSIYFNKIFEKWLNSPNFMVCIWQVYMHIHAYVYTSMHMPVCTCLYIFVPYLLCYLLLLPYI